MCSSNPRSCRSVINVANAVELADLLEVKVEVLAVCVVVRMGDAHVVDPALHEAAREQTVAAKVVGAVALLVFRIFLGDVEDLALPHEFEALLVALRVGVGLRSAAPEREPVIHFPPQIIRAHRRGFQRCGRFRKLRRLAVAEHHAGILGAEVGGVRAAA